MEEGCREVRSFLVFYPPFVAWSFNNKALSSSNEILFGHDRIHSFGTKNIFILPRRRCCEGSSNTIFLPLTFSGLFFPVREKVASDKPKGR